ncbi:MAG: type I glyceraldehyde-3-phosphate dehydrogenase, partial [bacterium]|nr:type I glyceraldehyde-3-phosphate dehydrogenase [bacterium]
PWGDLKVDLVVEATGVFERFEQLKGHLVAGAKKAVLTTPAKDEDGEGQTILVGVNDGKISEVNLTSNASCTTNAAAPVIEVLRQNPGILKAVLSTVHSYTATQSLVDGAIHGSDFRRGRAAGQNIVPSTTGAALAVTRAIPELVGKFDGVSLRVPTVTGSIADITFLAARPTTVEEINGILEKAATEKRWQGILKTTNEQLVSSDIVGEPFAAIVDLNFTKVVDGDLVKVFSWYDNEWGYVAVLAKHILRALDL